MPEKEAKETITALGHMNVRATHRTTLEFTKDRHLSGEGDCIVGTASDKSVADLCPEFTELLRKPDARLTLQVEAGEVIEEIHAFGSPRLILSHPTDIVVRKSDYICSRTIAVKADKAAMDLSRKLVEKLKNPQQKAKITLSVKY